jgi:hypothetical protein
MGRLSGASGVEEGWCAEEEATLAFRFTALAVHRPANERAPALVTTAGVSTGPVDGMRRPSQVKTQAFSELS